MLDYNVSRLTTFLNVLVSAVDGADIPNELLEERWSRFAGCTRTRSFGMSDFIDPIAAACLQAALSRGLVLTPCKIDAIDSSQDRLKPSA